MAYYWHYGTMLARCRKDRAPLHGIAAKAGRLEIAQNHLSLRVNFLLGDFSALESF